MSEKNLKARAEDARAKLSETVSIVDKLADNPRFQRNASAVEGLGRQLDRDTASLDKLRETFETAGKAYDASPSRETFHRHVDAEVAYHEAQRASEAGYSSVEAMKADAHQAQRAAERIAIPDDDGRSSSTHEFARLELQRDALTYRKDNQTQTSFFKDAIAARTGSGDAAERLSRHTREMIGNGLDKRTERFDLSTGSGVGAELTPPAYLQNEFATYARASRPYVEYLGPRELPGNTNTLTVPVMSGGASVAVQSSENSSISNTDPTFTTVTSNISTVAGYVDLSVQLFERGIPGADQVVWGDLARAYASKTESDALSANSTNYRGILSVSSTNTDTITTTTVSSLYSKIIGLSSAIGTSYLKQSADHVVMHPRRYAALMAASDTTGRPLLTTFGPFNNPSATSAPAGASGVIARLGNLDVIASNNVPSTLGATTSEDRVILGVRDEFYFWESGPYIGVFPDVKSSTLETRIRLHGYISFQFGRYAKAIGLLSGSGLVTPTFA